MENQLDPQVVNLAKAIRQTESGGDYTVKGASGENGGYQFTEPTWNAAAPKYGIKTSLKDATPEQQNAVAYNRIKEWKDSGKNVTQIASMWNAGEGEPDAYTGKFSDGSPSKGISYKHNPKGVRFDVPTYAKSVAQAYLTLKNGGQVQADPNNPSSVAAPQEPQGETYGASFPAEKGEGLLQAGAKALGNVPSSTANLVGNIGNMLNHPIDTVHGLLDVGAGGVNAILGKLGLSGNGNQEQTQKFEKVKNALIDRYGGLENIQKTATNDPVGFALDAVSLLEGGAGLADSALGTTGEALTKTAAETVDAAEKAKLLEGGVRTMPAVTPQEGLISGAVKSGIGAVKDAATYIPQKVGGLLGNLGAEAIGKVTGAGGDVVKAGLEASKKGGDAYGAYVDALKGNVSPESLVDSARGALDQVVQERSTQYRSMLDNLSKDPTTYDISPVVKEVATQMDDKHFNIGVNDDGSLDFSRSKIRFNKQAQTDIQTIYDEMKSYGLKPGDRTATGIDNLKQAFYSLDKPSSDVRSFATAVAKKTRGVLENAPGYSEAMKNYADISEQINDIQKNLSLGDKAMVETTFKKLTSSLRQNNEMRGQILRELNDASGGTLIPKIAGQQLSPLLPRGLAGVLEGAGGIASIASGGTGLLPLLGSVAISSPKIVGTFLRGLGLGDRAVTQAIALLTSGPVKATAKMGNIAGHLKP